MKPLQDLKKRFLKSKFGNAQRTQKGKNTELKTLITNSFFDDEDLFLFI